MEILNLAKKALLGTSDRLTGGSMLRQKSFLPKSMQRSLRAIVQQELEYTLTKRQAERLKIMA